MSALSHSCLMNPFWIDTSPFYRKFHWKSNEIFHKLASPGVRPYPSLRGSNFSKKSSHKTPGTPSLHNEIELRPINSNKEKHG